jgi:hypothetical protein
MNIVNNSINKILSILGYEIKRISHEEVKYENFVDLLRVFEHFLKEVGFDIPKNDLRPRLLGRLTGTPPSEAYYIIGALTQVTEIDGDVCEFGVAQGETSALIGNEISTTTSKILHLFDSFEGLPKPSAQDKLKDDILSLGNMAAYAGKMSYPKAMVLARLKAISFPNDRYEIHKGFIEDLIQDDLNLPSKVCFAYVDFDFFEPIRITLEYLHNVTPLGAKINVDDYDFFSTGVKTAVDEFVKVKNATEVVYDCNVPSSRYGKFIVLTKMVDSSS